MNYANDVSTQPTKSPRTDGGLASSLRISVMRLARRMRTERDATDDLSLNQLAVLGTLDRHGPLSAGELAGIERVQPPSLTRTVNCLVERGLVVREPHSTDGRQVVVRLAQSGRTFLMHERRRRDAWMATQLRGLTVAERDLLRRAAPILDRLAQS
jgi:DNA-binding MarR family transcriptional regulator